MTGRASSHELAMLSNEGETMNRSLWRMAIALSIATALVLAARYFGWSHFLSTVE
jgi:hypothetical protein